MPELLIRIPLYGVLCLAAVSCETETIGQVSDDQPIEYGVSVTASELARLPRCTTALNGTIAHVDSPSGLWSCGFGHWRQIPCSASNSGDVAYATEPPALWTCVKNDWTMIALSGPTGPQGPQGARGPQGATGARGLVGDSGASSLVRVSSVGVGSDCAEGGVRVETGIDDNRNGTLENTEVDATSFVCNGASPAVCGNGKVEAGEECDTGSPVDTRSCNRDCSALRCGDDYINRVAGEECEDGNDQPGDGCSSICRVEPASCGEGARQCVGLVVQTCDADGVWQPFETCPDMCHLGLCHD